MAASPSVQRKPFTDQNSWKPSVSSASSASATRIRAACVTWICRNATPNSRGSRARPNSRGMALRERIRMDLGLSARRNARRSPSAAAASSACHPPADEGQDHRSAEHPAADPHVPADAARLHQPRLRRSAPARMATAAAGAIRNWRCGTASDCRRRDSSRPARRQQAARHASRARRDRWTLPAPGHPT